MSSKVPKWIILFQFQSQSQPQSQVTSNENVPSEGGVSKEAEVWIMEGPKTGSRKRNRKFAAHMDKKRYEGRFVRRHAHWHKRAKEAHQAKRVQTDGGAVHIKSQMLADTKVREPEEDIGRDESQFGIKIVAATPKTNFELPDDNRAPQAENVSGVDEHEIRIWSRFKTNSEILGAAEGSEVEQAIEIDEPEVDEHKISIWSRFKTKSELLGPAEGSEVEQATEIDEPEVDEDEIRMWSRFKTKSELLGAAEGPEVEQATEIDEPEVDEHEIRMWSRFKIKSELLGAAEGPEVEQATEIDEPEFKMWANVINSTCKTKCELSDDANAPKAEQVTRVTSGTTSELSDGKKACDEVCEEAYDYLPSSCCSQVQ